MWQTSQQSTKWAVIQKKQVTFFANKKLECSNENRILEILYLLLWTSQIPNT